MLDSDDIPTRSHSNLMVQLRPDPDIWIPRLLLFFLRYHGDAQTLTGGAYHKKGSTRVKKIIKRNKFKGNAPSQPSPTYKFFLLLYVVDHIFLIEN